MMLLKIAVAGLLLTAATAAAADSCKMTEGEIRQLWLVYKYGPHGNGDEARATAMTQQAALAAERSCNERKTWRPAALPAELQKLTR